jgi:hypothetical protein
MESASIRRLPALPGLVQIGLIVMLVALAAVAWAQPCCARPRPWPAAVDEPC